MNAQISALRTRAIHQFDRMLTLRMFDSGVITRTENTLFTVGATIVTAESLLSSAEYLLENKKPPHKMQGDTCQLSSDSSNFVITLKLGADSLGRMGELLKRVTLTGVTTQSVTAHGALEMRTLGDGDAASRMIDSAKKLIEAAEQMVKTAEHDLHELANIRDSAAA